MIQSIPKPEWVMMGAPAGADHYMLIASNELNYAELANEFHYRDWGEFLRQRKERKGMPRIGFTMELKKLTIITGKDYMECLARLFEVWMPGEANLPVSEQIANGRLALPAGDDQ